MSTIVGSRQCSICTEPMTVKRITTDVAGTVPVDLAMCVNCDTRRCQYKDDGLVCDARVLDPRAKRCPRGHWL